MFTTSQTPAGEPGRPAVTGLAFAVREPGLRLRVCVGPARRIRIVAAGSLDAAWAQLLTDTVRDTLRRHQAAVCELDLSAVTGIDRVGAQVLTWCEQEAHRRGLLFAVVDGTA